MNKQSGFIGIIAIILITLGLAGGIYLQKTGKIDVLKNKGQQAITPIQDNKVNKTMTSDTRGDQNIASISNSQEPTVGEGQKKSTHSVSIVSEKEQLFKVYIEASDLLKKKNMEQILSYLRILNQYEPSESFELSLQRLEKYPEEFYSSVDKAAELIGVDFITKEKFLSGTWRSENDFRQVIIPAKQAGSVQTLFFVKINNSWYLNIPID